MAKKQVTRKPNKSGKRTSSPKPNTERGGYTTRVSRPSRTTQKKEEDAQDMGLGEETE